MATKGYNSYRGRTSGGKIALIVVLALVLVGAVAYLALQDYVVYDEAGNARIELPFFHKKSEDQGDGAPGGDTQRDDIVDTVAPEHPHVEVAALHGTRLPDDCLWWGADYIMNTLAPEDLVLAVKRSTGGITYATGVETPRGVVVETGRPIECLNTLLQSGRYTVGHLACFLDSAYARALPETALVREDGQLWYDGQGQAWLDPTNAQVLQYITALVKECGELGFKEVLLDWFCYPADTTGAANIAPDKAQALADFAEKLRAALPEGVALSVVVRDTESLSITQQAELFDRLYVPADGDLAAVKAALPAGYDPETRVVAMTAEAAQSGSYMVVQ